MEQSSFSASLPINLAISDKLDETFSLAFNLLGHESWSCPLRTSDPAPIVEVGSFPPHEWG